MKIHNTNTYTDTQTQTIILPNVRNACDSLFLGRQIKTVFVIDIAQRARNSYNNKQTDARVKTSGVDTVATRTQYAVDAMCVYAFAVFQYRVAQHLRKQCDESGSSEVRRAALTSWPASSMRAFSTSSVGLWSTVNSTASPLLQSHDTHTELI